MNTEYSGKEIVSMIQDTSQLMAHDKIDMMVSAAAAWKTSQNTAGNIEFWKWMNRNYSGANGHMFESNSAMQNYIASSQGKADWMYKQLQGKGYEWDWMTKQKNSVKSLFKKYSAGDVSNQPGYDVVEKNLLSKEEGFYQMKAYISKKNPDLHNTDKNIKVVTNAEKVEGVQNRGYDVEQFKSRDQIIRDTDSRINDISKGYANSKYNIQNISITMAKAGAVACIVGMGIESVNSYQLWKNGDLSDEEYVNEIMKVGVDSGVTAAASAGIMVPVSGVITAAGISSYVTIPIAFVVGGVVNEIVAPCFGQGKYQKILENARYYQRLEECYNELLRQISYSADEYIDFVNCYQMQENKHRQMKRTSMELNKSLKDLYDSI